MKKHGLDDVMQFGEFLGLTVRQALERNPRLLFRMQNGTGFDLDDEALDLLKKELR